MLAKVYKIRLFYFFIWQISGKHLAVTGIWYEKTKIPPIFSEQRLERGGIFAISFAFYNTMLYPQYHICILFSREYNYEISAFDNKI